MGKVLRGKGTTDQWWVAQDLRSARMDIIFSVNHDNYNSMTKEQRAEIATFKEALPKSLLVRALTQRRRMRSAGRTIKERIAWLKTHSYGLGLDGQKGLNNFHLFMQTLERWLTEWPVLIRLAEQNPDGARIFTRRRSVYGDEHVGIHVGSSGGMPRNAYSSITILPQMRDADLTYLRRLHAKLKPLADLFSQTVQSSWADSTHERNIAQLETYASEIKQLEAVRDEWLEQDAEANKWLDSRPDFIKDGKLNIRISTDRSRDATFYQLLGRRSWESAHTLAQKYHESTLQKVDNYTPDITANMVDRKAVEKAIVGVMEDAVKWACTYEADYTTDGGEEE